MVSNDPMKSQGVYLVPPSHIAASNPWQHNTAYLSPVLAFHLGFQPQLMPFLLNASPDQQQSQGATQPCTTPSPGPSPSAMRQLSSTPDNRCDWPMPFQEPHDRQQSGRLAAANGSNNEPAGHPRSECAGQHAQGTSLELCREGEPWWHWVGGRVCLQSLQAADANPASFERPQHTVSIPQPGDFLMPICLHATRARHTWHRASPIGCNKGG